MKLRLPADLCCLASILRISATGAKVRGSIVPNDNSVI